MRKVSSPSAKPMIHVRHEGARCSIALVTNCTLNLIKNERGREGRSESELRYFSIRRMFRGLDWPDIAPLLKRYRNTNLLSLRELRQSPIPFCRQPSAAGRSKLGRRQGRQESFVHMILSPLAFGF